jgi:4-amino-4-deoxychorismate lyase
MSRLIETIRVSEGKAWNTDYHFKRMRRSLLSWDLRQILDISLPSRGIHKLRIVYDGNYFEHSVTPYTIRPVRSLKLVSNNDIVYDKKYEDRTELNEMFDRREGCDDILIIKDDLVTDVSHANIIFKRNDQWFTPDSFLLNGTMRQFLLDNKLIFEAHITPRDLSQYSHFKLINAMLRDEAPESEVLNIR